MPTHTDTHTQAHKHSASCKCEELHLRFSVYLKVLTSFTLNNVQLPKLPSVSHTLTIPSSFSSFFSCHYTSHFLPPCTRSLLCLTQGNESGIQCFAARGMNLLKAKPHTGGWKLLPVSAGGSKLMRKQMCFVQQICHEKYPLVKDADKFTSYSIAAVGTTDSIISKIRMTSTSGCVSCLLPIQLEIFLY